jgi:uncharacterized protein YbaR (Trm112 family)
MRSYVVDLLQCPQCLGALTWDITARSGDRIEEATAMCATCHASYPVREGIGLFLTPDLPRNDLWEQAEGGLTAHLRQSPDVERRLMNVPLEALGPADLFFRAMALEDRGEYAEAKAAAKLAHPQLYTAEYRACFQSQRAYVLEQMRGSATPIVDLASGRGDLVELFARQLTCPIIASDFSPRILRRDRRWLEYWGLYDRVTLLAFDARKTPFKDGAITRMTTNLGLPNVDEPGRLLPELRRIVGGTLLAISYFFPEDDAANAAAIRKAGSGAMLFKRQALAAFRSAGWSVELANACSGRARPTPRGVVIEDAAIDGLPVAETVLEWGTLVAR